MEATQAADRQTKRFKAAQTQINDYVDHVHADEGHQLTPGFIYAVRNFIQHSKALQKGFYPAPSLRYRDAEDALTEIDKRIPGYWELVEGVADGVIAALDGYEHRKGTQVSHWLNSTMSNQAKNVYRKRSDEADASVSWNDLYESIGSHDDADDADDPHETISSSHDDVDAPDAGADAGTPAPWGCWNTLFPPDDCPSFLAPVPMRGSGKVDFEYAFWRNMQRKIGDSLHPFIKDAVTERVQMRSKASQLSPVIHNLMHDDEHGDRYRLLFSAIVDDVDDASRGEESKYITSGTGRVNVKALYMGLGLPKTWTENAMKRVKDALANAAWDASATEWVELLAAYGDDDPADEDTAEQAESFTGWAAEDSALPASSPKAWAASKADNVREILHRDGPRTIGKHIANRDVKTGEVAA